MKIRHSTTLESFNKLILNLIRPTQNSTFKLHSPLGIIVPARLRVGASHWKEHKFKHCSQDFIVLLCICVNSIESTIHSFLQSTNYTFQGHTLLNKTSFIDPNILAQKLENSVIKAFLYERLISERS